MNTQTDDCRPLKLENKILDRQLVVYWDDQITTTLSHAFLRRKCRCADCLSGRLVPPAEAELTELHPYGPNAVQLVFSDGHNRGLYPWPYLRNLAIELATQPE